ncbi:MAG: transglutaminase-like domain-containing protein [Sphingomonadales bacterium]|nr:transglutaminase-like domain-containing protein [Sphingomonadales bacterium]
MIDLASGSAKIAFKASPGEMFLLPGPLNLFGLSSDVAVEGLELLDLLPGSFGPQQAAVVRATCSTPSARYRWTKAEDDQDHGWLWYPPDHALSRSSPELVHHVSQLVADLDEPRRERAVIAHAASSFRYGHGDDRFTDGTDAVPVLSCGLTQGSCVDIHTYAVAALRSAGLRAAYVAGVFWPDGETAANDMHCWIATGLDGGRFWDLSHDIVVGREPQPDLLAKPGRRLPFSIGRGLRFKWRDDVVEISHFALPHRLSDNGATEVPAQLTFADAVP